MATLRSKIKTVSVFLLSIVLVLCAGAILVGCGDKEVNKLILEAEEAVVEGTPKSGSVFIERDESKSDNSSSNAKYLKNLAVKGNKVVWVFNAAADAASDLYLVVANAKSGAGEFTAGADKIFSLTLNGAAVTVPETVVAAASTYCDLWQSIKIEGVTLKSGLNTVELKITGTDGEINVDYLGVDMDKASVEKHDHAWDSDIIASTCEEGGSVYRVCKTCKLRYLLQETAAVGHKWGNYHFDETSGKMMKVCENDNGHKEYADAPNSKFFGEVFNEKDEFSTKANETVYEAELAKVDITGGGLNNGDSYVENVNGASGGKIVANISKAGNFVEFTVKATKDCTVDLAFVVANVLWTSEGIGVLDPLSQYMEFTVNDEKVDFSYVAFPGDSEYNWYNWRYIVMKNITLSEGENALIYKPIVQQPNKDQEKEWVTVPNLDVLYIYADEAGILSISRTYDINDALIDNAFVSEFDNAFDMVKTEDKKEFTLKLGKANTADLILDIQGAENIADLSKALEILINGKSVNLENLSIVSGAGNLLVVKGLSLNAGVNTVTFKGEIADIVGIKGYAENKAVGMINAELNAADYDYMINNGAESKLVPKLVFEAEDAELPNKKNDTITNADTASGGKDIENYGTKNNKIIWKVNASGNATADIAIRMACSNWDGSGNSAMTGLSNYFLVTIDGVAVDISQLSLTCTDGSSWYDWNVLVMKGLNLTQGEHEIVLTCISKMPNTDVLYVYSADSVDFTAVATPPAPAPAPTPEA